MLSKSQSLIQSWENINYCHWKSNEHLMEGLLGDTDLDVLVDENDKEKAEAALKKCGYMQCRSQYGSRYPGVDDWIGFDEKTGKLIHIHLHYHIVTGHKGMKEYNLPWTQRTLETRIKDQETGVYIMEPNLEIVTLYTRIGLKASVKRLKMAKAGKFVLGEDDLREINYLKKRIDLSKVHSILEEYYGKHTDEMLKIMEQDTIDSQNFVRLSKTASAAFAKCRRNNGFVCTLKKYYYIIAMRVISFVRHRMQKNIITRKTNINGKGCVIAFIGQDGAGKSTVTSDIVKWLTWKLDAKKFYLGSGEHYHSWQKKWHSKLPKKKNAITAALGAWLILSDYVALAKNVQKTIIKAEKYAAKGGIAVFDRYPQNQFIGINDGAKIRTLYVPKIKNKLIRKYALSRAKKEEQYIAKAVSHFPQLVIKLILPPEVSLQRKPEENIDIVRRKHEVIKSLAFEQSEVHTIDATMPYEEEIVKIKELIWQKIQ